MNRKDQDDRAFLRCLYHGWALRLADRQEDRARQRCRRKGLAVYDREAGAWKLTPAGEAVAKEDLE